MQKSKYFDKLMIELLFFIYLIIIMKVYSPSENHKLNKILFTARIFEKNVTHVEVPFNNKNKAFLQAYPNCSMPALENQNHLFLFGQNTIIQYLSPQLQCPFEDAQVKQWIQTIEKQIQVPTGVLVLAQKGYEIITEQQKNKAIQSFAKFLKTLDEKLKLRTFIVGNSLSVADISAFFNLKTANQAIKEKFKGLSHVSRWYNYIESIS